MPVSDPLPDACFRAIVEQVNVPVLVFAERQIVYKNRAVDRLFTRLRARYGVEPSVILRDQLARLDAMPVVDASPVIALLTTGRGEPLHERVQLGTLADDQRRGDQRHHGEREQRQDAVVGDRRGPRHGLVGVEALDCIGPDAQEGVALGEG